MTSHPGMTDRPDVPMFDNGALLAALALRLVKSAINDVLDARLQTTALLVDQVIPLPRTHQALLVQHLTFLAARLGAAHPAEVRRALLDPNDEGEI